MIKIILPFLFLISSAVPLFAESATGLLKQVNKDVSKRSYIQALHHLELARDEIEKLRNRDLKTFFPDTLSDLVGEDFKASSALGMTNMERQYTGDEKLVALSVIGAGKGGTFDKLVGTGRVAKMLEEGKGEKFQIEGFPAFLDGSGVWPELSVFLGSGGIVKIEGRKHIEAEQLKKIAQGINFGELDRYLQGNAIAKHSKKSQKTTRK